MLSDESFTKIAVFELLDFSSKTDGLEQNLNFTSIRWNSIRASIRCTLSLNSSEKLIFTLQKGESMAVFFLVHNVDNSKYGFD